MRPALSPIPISFALLSLLKRICFVGVEGKDMSSLMRIKCSFEVVNDES